MAIPNNFQANLQAESNISLSREQIETGKKLWLDLSDEIKKTDIAYPLILQGVELLSDLHYPKIDDPQFRKGFNLLKDLPIDQLKDAYTHHKIAVNILAEGEATADEMGTGTPSPPFIQSIAKKSFDEIAETFGEHPVITKATMIGEGNYGDVYLVNEIAGWRLSEFTEVAVKVAKPTQDSIDDIRSEIDFLNAVYQSNLTGQEKKEIGEKPIKVTFEGREGFLKNYRPEGNLSDYLLANALSMKEKINLAKQLIYKLSLLSSIGAIYTDIKPENIMVEVRNTGNVYSFSDFGSCYLARQPEHYPANGFTSTPSRVMTTDYNNLLAAAKNAKNDPTNPDLQRALETASNKHLSRAVGLLLAEIFDEQLTPFTQAYTFNQLKGYYQKSQPLKSLHEANSTLAHVIEGMLGLTGREQLLPLESWASCGKFSRG